MPSNLRFVAQLFRGGRSIGPRRNFSSPANNDVSNPEPVTAVILRTKPVFYNSVVAGLLCRMAWEVYGLHKVQQVYDKHENKLRPQQGHDELEIPFHKGRQSDLDKLTISDNTRFSNNFGYNEEIIQTNEELKEKVSALETAKADTEEQFRMMQKELTTTKTKLETTNTTLETMVNYMRSKFDDCPSFK